MENKKDKLFLVGIFMLFLSPFLIAWWLLNNTDTSTTRSKSHSGELIVPPKQIDNLSLLDPIKNRDYQLQGKWSMVYIADTCDEACANNLYKMRQIHTAMHKHSLRVQRVLLLASPPIEQNLGTLFADYEGQRIVKIEELEIHSLLEKFKLIEAEDPLSMYRLYIVDPLGNLMMMYPEDASPRAIMKDLKKLLKASRIG